MAPRTGVFLDRLVFFTERFLTRRRQRRRLKKERQKKKNVVLDWLEAFFWAAGWVLIINQYLVQAYQIPSGSMIDTLLIGDHIFVNKLVFGPELLPGFLKLPSPVRPKRNDIIIFENPSYLSRGVVFDVAQRVIYMLTLTLVDIDKDESGSPRVHFLIKRAAGMGGGSVCQRKGGAAGPFRRGGPLGG
jgi:signal peptidase I